MSKRRNKSSAKNKREDHHECTVVYGVCYPAMEKSTLSNTRMPLKTLQYVTSNEVKTELERQMIAKDPVVKLKREEVRPLDGLPLFNSHKKRVGTILCNSIEPSGEMKVLATVDDAQTRQALKSGKISQFSIFYDKSFDQEGNTTRVNFHEVSVVEEGVHKGCNIEVVAGKRKSESSLKNGEPSNLFEIM
jgi:hypothetical protein